MQTRTAAAMVEKFQTNRLNLAPKARRQRRARISKG
jgi:hypothetical protein